MKQRLSDFITLQRGFDLPASQRVFGKVPVVASTGIVAWHNQAKVKAPGVVIGRSGSIGGGQFVEQDFWPLNTTLYVKDFKGNNPRYAYYALKTIDFSAFNAGAGVPTLNRNHIASIEIEVLPLPIQDRIAGILSDYDSAIANCRKQIALLEEAAMRLYREWFKDGKGEKKRIWEILRHYANGGWGKENSIGKFTECGYVIRGTDIDDLSYGNRSSIPLRVHSKHDIEAKRLISGDIIIELSNGNIDNIGRSLLVSDDMLSWFDDVVICASFCKFMRPIDNQMSIALAWHIKYLQSSGKMKVFKNAGANGINNFAFDEFLDSEIQLGDFDSKLFTVLGNMTLQTQTMRSQIRTLTEARDRLLPKLMSGEIEV